MADQHLTESLQTMARFVVGDLTVEETLLRVSELLVEDVPNADVVGITMIVAGKPETTIYTNPLSPKVDEAQYQAGAGPCLDAMKYVRVQSLDSTSEVGPWPEFRRAAADHGIGSVLSLPLEINKTCVGAMNLYAKRHRAFDEEDRRRGGLFAAQAATVLANAQLYADARNLGEHLGDAMRSRATIEQAKGILMSAQHCDADAAFQLLVHASQRENVKLREIATRIVANATGAASNAS